MNLEMRNVSKSYCRNGRAVIALEKIDLTVNTGEFVCLLGPSGCGKSTLLNMLAGIDMPSTGQVAADGETICGPAANRTLIFQDAGLFPWLTVQANVEFGLKMKGLPRATRERTASELLQTVHLEQFSRSWVHELSGGMKQRVALARALAVEPQVLLLDEPFAALDAITRDQLHIELQEIWLKTGKTIVFVTHNVREAVVLGDRVLVMSARPGRLIAEHSVNLPRLRHIEDEGIMPLVRRLMADLRLKETPYERTNA